MLVGHVRASKSSRPTFLRLMRNLGLEIVAIHPLSGNRAQLFPVSAGQKREARLRADVPAFDVLPVIPGRCEASNYSVQLRT
jgi:hypothetical protein